MKKQILFVLLFALIGGVLFAADPAEGFWISVDEKTGKQTAGWEIWQENGKLYGKILSIADNPQDIKAGGAGKSYDNFQNGVDVSTLNIIGTTWIWDLTKQKDEKWGNGYIIDPESGSRYKCKITFHKADGKKYLVDTLEMRGELGPFGRSQFWQKSTKEAASALR
jgi:uncharacterized protein (DUF2147 family)